MGSAMRGGLSKYVTISLLVLISVSIALGTYAAVENFISRRGIKGLNPTVITIEKVCRGDPVVPVVVAFVRNDGDSPAVVDTAYVRTSNGVEKVKIGPYKIPVGSLIKVVIPTNLTKYEVFNIKIAGRGFMTTSASDLRLVDLPLYEVLHRSTVTITERSGETLRDYAVNVTLTPAWGGWNRVKSDGSDIFFVTASGDPLYYWIENFNPSAKEATIWVKVPNIPANGKVNIYMYYGYSQYLSTNPYADHADPHKVFIFFDNFESWQGWTTYLNGVVEQSSSCVYDGNYSLEKDGSSSANCDPSGGYKALPKTITDGWILEAWMYRYSLPVNCPWDRIGVINSLGNGYGIAVDTGIGGTSVAVGIDKRTDYSGTVSSTVYATTPFYDQWYFVKFYKIGSTLNASVYFANKTLIFTTQEIDTTYTSFDEVYVFGGVVYFVDDLRIRPYTNPEPSVTVTG